MGRKVEAGKPATAPVQAGTAERSEARRGGGNERAEVLFRKRSPRDWVTGSEQGGRRGGARGATLAGRRGQTPHAPPAQLPPCPSCCRPSSRLPPHLCPCLRVHRAPSRRQAFSQALLSARMVFSLFARQHYSSFLMLFSGRLPQALPDPPISHLSTSIGALTPLGLDIPPELAVSAMGISVV